MYAAGDYAQDGIELSGGVEWLKVDYPMLPGSASDAERAARHGVLQRDPRSQPEDRWRTSRTTPGR